MSGSPGNTCGRLAMYDTGRNQADIAHLRARESANGRAIGREIPAVLAERATGNFCSLFFSLAPR